MVVPLNLLTVSIIARTLGPELYGDYRYLIYFFTLLSSFIGFGGNFFTTELAKNHYDEKLVSFYLNYILLNWVAACLFIFVIRYTNLSTTFFPSKVQVQYIWIAFLLSFFTFLSQFLESMTDSCGLTKSASIFNFFAKLFGLGVLCLLIYIVDWTNLLSVFLYSIAVVVFTVIGFGMVLKSNNIPVLNFKISLPDFKKRAAFFFSYSHPLLVLSIVTFAVGFLGRWILQFFGGSVQQGYFSFSDSFSAFIIIFSNSITPLLQREFAISFSNQDLHKMKNLFQKSLLIFTGVTSFLAVFVMINADFFTLLIGGMSFKNAILPTQIMLFYPIPYVANNILYATIYAVGKTALLRNVQILMCILNLIFTYFLVAPANYFGLELGAVGFVISMLSVTYLNHFVLLRYCTPMFDLKYIKIIANYFIILLALLVVGFASKFLIDILNMNSLISIFLAGVIYTLIAGLLFSKSPTLFGFSAEEVQILRGKILKFRFLKRN